MAARIEVEHLKGDDFRVTVREGGGRTVHTVTVEPAYAQRLTGGAVPPEELVRRSFEFLLAREPKESILGSFALSVISRYFPDYETEIARRVRGG
jgi:hypothetical protein